jgi:hypothetical protein
MPYERTGYAPWSLTREAGVQSATVDGTIQVPQYVQPTLSTGFVDEKGNWQGIKSNDEVFIGFTKALAIPNGANSLFPDTNNHPSINMEGFSHLQFVAKSSNDGAFRIDAKSGPDTVNTLNVTLTPSADIKMAGIGDPQSDTGFADALFDASETLTSGFRIFTVYDRLKDLPNFQILLTNNTGGDADIEFAFRRLV